MRINILIPNDKILPQGDTSVVFIGTLDGTCDVELEERFGETGGEVHDRSWLSAVHTSSGRGGEWETFD